MNEEHRSATREARRVTLAAIVANLFLAGLKIVCGLVGHSHALVADGAHSLSDSTTDAVVLIGIGYWSRPPDESHPHGHGRMETVASLVIAAFLALIAIGITYDALGRIADPHPPPRWIALVAAAAAIVIKELIFRWTRAVGRKHRSPALIANAWHHRSDSFSSVPVVIAVLVGKINPDWAFVDHVAAIVVSVLILRVAWSIGWPSLKELVDTAAPPSMRNRIEQVASETAGVKEVHGVRTRYVGGGVHADLHIGVSEHLTVRQGHDIAEQVKERMVSDIAKLVDVVVHLEPVENGQDARSG